MLFPYGNRTPDFPQSIFHCYLAEGSRFNKSLFSLILIRLARVLLYPTRGLSKLSTLNVNLSL